MKRIVPWVSLLVVSAVICTALWVSVMQSQVRYEQRRAAMSAGWTRAVAEVTSANFTWRKWHSYKVTFRVVAAGRKPVEVVRITNTRAVSSAYPAWVNDDGLRVWTALDGVPDPTVPVVSESSKYGLMVATAVSTVITATLGAVTFVVLYQTAQVVVLRRKRRKAGIIELTGAQRHLKQLLDQMSLIPEDEEPQLQANLRRRILRLMQVNGPNNLFVISETVAALENQVLPQSSQDAA